MLIVNVDGKTLSVLYKKDNSVYTKDIAVFC